MAKDKVRLAHPTIPKEVDRYLVPTEQVIFMVNLHPVSQTVIAAKVAGSLLAVLLLQILTQWRLPRFLALPVTLGLIGWGVYSYIDYRYELFLATDRRLMLVHGVLTRKVDMMPMGKVTDMRYDRTPAGKLLGYGTFVLESAGQDQALSTIKFVPRPDTMYRSINTVLFSPASRRIGDRPPPMGSALPLQEANDMWWKKR